ncbi:Universal stress protein family protein [Lutibacter agarilyticus]|uniref:Universal stress protein family protein n=1 Tax=Lutibacter agarilyticus TaxID=1109740 RepID=A0A238XB54_9FLAO|nr:universal stress protein [Lutibacter agarilyticus]SNR56276.1 Universal stress protein family protein [Lutibacter agarilyticus]
MKNYKYKILVLSDLKKNASSTLKSSVSLANMIDAEIALFHVKEHIDILKRDNQLSSMRTLNDEHKNIKKKIHTIVNDFSKEYNVKINGDYAFGKVKEEIEKQIQIHNPDIIVLGQREPAPFKLLGDSITRFILKKFKGIIMITSNENTLVPNEKVALGVLNGSTKFLKNKLSNDLITHSKAPLKSFRILNSQNLNTPKLNEEKMVEYVFEQNDNAMTTLSSYLQKNNINLLCVDRDKNKANNTINADTSLKEVVSKLNVSLLVSEA